MQNVQLQKGGHGGGKHGWRQEEQPGEVCAAEFDCTAIIVSGISD